LAEGGNFDNFRERGSDLRDLFSYAVDTWAVVDDLHDLELYELETAATLLDRTIIQLDLTWTKD
jgi:hypothetical protein